MLRATTFAAASVIALSDVPPPNYAMLWEGWKQTNQKYLPSDSNGVDTEERYRFGVFRKNVDVIYAANREGNSFTVGVNKFADLTNAEFASKYLGYKVPNATELYGGAPYLGEHVLTEEPPASVDWTTQGAVTAIKDQGQCGSCWTFSATGALEGAWKIAGHDLISLSEQQIVDCDHSLLPPTMGCNGGSMGAAFSYVEKSGLCLEESYAYEAATKSCRASQCSDGIPKGGVTGWKGLAPIGRVIPASLKTMMSAVAQQPVSVAIEADKDVFHFYTGGVVTGDCGSMPDHGVLVVGYGTDASLGAYWRIKNSWGADWGEEGFVRIARGKGGKGECSVLNSPSYPVVPKVGVVV